MTKRVRDCADIQSEVDRVANEINDVEMQMRKAEAKVEQATQAKAAAMAELRKIADELNCPNLNEQVRADWIAKQRSCAKDLEDAESELEELREEKKQLREEKKELREEKKQLREEKRDGERCGRCIGGLSDRLGSWAGGNCTAVQDTRVQPMILRPKNASWPAIWHTLCTHGRQHTIFREARKAVCSEWAHAAGPAAVGRGLCAPGRISRV